MHRFGASAACKWGLSLMLAVVAAAAPHPVQYWQDAPGFFERQAEVSLETVGEILARFPPARGAAPERRQALVLLDQVLHDELAPRRPAVQGFFQRQIRRAVDEIKRSQVRSGASIWKIYNHAFVVRTPTVTMGFDLTLAGTAGAEGFLIPSDIMRELVAQCDVLFVSHRHRDHADEQVAEWFLDQGKPVVAPPSVWMDRDFASRLTRLPRSAEALHHLPVRSGQAALQVVVFPGHQKAVENNVVVVTTPERLRFCHTGDQNNAADSAWMGLLAGSGRVDVLLPNCWSPDMPQLFRGANPRLVIPGHENELGHAVLHREPYWLTADRLEAVGVDAGLIMTWGENYHYEPTNDN